MKLSFSLLLLTSSSSASAFTILPPSQHIISLEGQATYTIHQNNIIHSFQKETISTLSQNVIEGINNYLLIPPAYATESTIKPPTNAEIKLLREAFAALYGERNPEKAEVLLGEAITAWERQPPDEKAALYRVRGDCYMVRVNKIKIKRSKRRKQKKHCKLIFCCCFFSFFFHFS